MNEKEHMTVRFRTIKRALNDIVVPMDRNRRR